MLELKRYVSNREPSTGAVLDEWVQQKTYERLIPSGAMQAQRDLFVMEMETILYILAWQDRVDHSSGRTLL
jgi:hypothetical protein